MHKFGLLYSHFIRVLFLILPDTPTIMRLRGRFYSLAMKSVGKNFQVASTSVLRGLGNISCGDNVYLGPNSYVMAREEIKIGSEVLVAMNVVIVDGNHGKDQATNSYRFSRGRQESITIGSGAWIAANCVITAGARVESGTFVPPCTVVRR